MPENTFDVVVVGSGIASLVCAAELGLKGRRVVVLERESVAGGCMRTSELTVPGFRHDVFAMSLPLFTTAAHFHTLGPELAKHGLELLSAPIPTAVATPDGRSLSLSRSRADNVANFDALVAGDGAGFERAMADIAANAPLIFGLLGQEPASASTWRLLAREIFRRKPSGLAQFGSNVLRPLRSWLEEDFRSDRVQALIAPWILHTGISPEAPLSALMGKLILFTLEVAGSPIVKGGIVNLVEAFCRLIRACGGTIVTKSDVTQIVIENGVATGVQTSNGVLYRARKAVVCNVTPTQLYGRLIPAQAVPMAFAESAKRYRYGRGSMQIHVALSEPAQWTDPQLNAVALIHVTPGLNGVSRAINEAERDLLPAEGTIVVGQPAVTDSSRCPPGAGLLWIQLLELPRSVRGDAAGVIAPSSDGGWTDSIRDAYAARILKRLGGYIINLEKATLAATALSPADLERSNINLVGGDPYSGAASLDQFHLFRPFGVSHNHDTPIKRLFHIGASTHPGAGLSGLSGHMVAAKI